MRTESLAPCSRGPYTNRFSTGRPQRISNEARTPYAILTGVVQKNAIGSVSDAIVVGLALPWSGLEPLPEPRWMCESRHCANEPLRIILQPLIKRGWSPLLEKRETRVTKFDETRELNIDELDGVSAGDMALNLAVKAYEALGKRLLDAVHQPVTQPTVTLHF